MPEMRSARLWRILGFEGSTLPEVFLEELKHLFFKRSIGMPHPTRVELKKRDGEFGEVGERTCGYGRVRVRLSVQQCVNGIDQPIDFTSDGLEVFVSGRVGSG